MGKAAMEQVVRIDVHEDRLAVRLKSADDEETSDAADDYFDTVAEAAFQEIQADSYPARTAPVAAVAAHTIRPLTKSVRRAPNLSPK
jgi:hypothetical protein